MVLCTNMEDGLIGEFPAGIQFQCCKIAICLLVEGHKRRVSYMIGLKLDQFTEPLIIKVNFPTPQGSAEKRTDLER